MRLSSHGRKHSPLSSSSLHSSRSDRTYHHVPREHSSREERRNNWEHGYRERSPLQHHSPTSEHRRHSKSHHHKSRFSEGQSPTYLYKPKSPSYSKQTPSPRPESPHFEDHRASYPEEEYEGRNRSCTPVEFLNEPEYTLPQGDYNFDEQQPDEDQYLEIDEVKDDLHDTEYVDPGGPHMYGEREILFSPRHEREVINQENEREVIAHSPERERFVTVVS